MKRSLVCLLLFIFLPTAQASAGFCMSSTRSTAVRNLVLELYTSEGCDSCPRADRWFSTLGTDTPRLLPLAFHVGYWDDIGWRDRFAQVEFAERQRHAVRRSGGRVVVTPQLLIDGQNARVGQIPAPSARSPAAEIELKSQGEEDRLILSARVDVPEAHRRAHAALWLAVTESGLTSVVTAGENRGVTLHHDHLVRTLVGPIALRTDGTNRVLRDIHLPPAWRREALRAVAFVEDPRTGEVLQAVGLSCRGQG